ncbi:alkylated DNA repair protein [Micromonospora sp. M42]|nr:alkylated DNA repair protein [Micromonospora sp. M42]
MPDVAYQPSMLDLAEQGPTLGPLAGAVRRHELSRGAWVDHLPGWVRGSDAVLDTLRHDVPWRAERRTMYDTAVDVPRLLCWYAAGRPLPHPVLTAARDGAHPGTTRPSWAEPFVTAGMCLYRSGATAWPGTATRWAAPRTPTPWWRSSRSAPRARCCSALAAEAAAACGSRSATATSW